MSATVTPRQKLALSIDDTAFALSISPKTIRNQLSAGSFPIAAHRIGDRVLFSIKEIEAFLAGARQPARRGRKRATA